MISFPKEADIINAISRLSNDNLLKLEDHEILQELEKFQSLALILIKIHKGSIIYRVRIADQDPFQIFTHQRELYYRTDVENINTYGRANIKNNVMFYGSIDNTNPQLAEITAYMESSSILHNQDTSKINEDLIHASQWIVEEDFEVVGIINHSKFHDHNPAAKDLSGRYLDFTKKYPEAEKALNLMIDFLAMQFAREVKKGEEWKYKVSSIFTQYLINKGFNGVLYPSVKAGGTTFNIAIHPSVADKFLRVGPIVYSEAYIKDKDILMGYNLLGKVVPAGEIKWSDVKSEHGLKNIDIKLFYKKHGFQR
jgi:hypothetical protein